MKIKISFWTNDRGYEEIVREEITEEDLREICEQRYKDSHYVSDDFAIQGIDIEAVEL